MFTGMAEIGRTTGTMTAGGTIKMIAETGKMTVKNRRRSGHHRLIAIDPFSMVRTGSTEEAAAIQGMCSMGQIGSMGEAVAIRVVALAVAGMDHANN